MTNHTDTSRSGDLVELLRRRCVEVMCVERDAHCAEAADRIEALEAENEQMVRFIRGLDCECDEYHGHRCNRCATLAARGEKQ